MRGEEVIVKLHGLREKKERNYSMEEKGILIL